MIHTHFGRIHTHFGRIHTHFRMIHSHFGMIHSHFGIIHSHFGLIHTHCAAIHTDWESLTPHPGAVDTWGRGAGLVAQVGIARAAQGLAGVGAKSGVDHGRLSVEAQRGQGLLRLAHCPPGLPLGAVAFEN